MMITLEIVCPSCGATHFVEVSEESWERYESGDLAQECFPYLSATEREEIISHLCTACQGEIFGEDFYEPDDLEMGFDPYEGGYTYDC